MPLTLWIDADAAPRDVKEICERASERLALPTVLVANQRLQLPVGHTHLSAVRVEGGPDVADRYIAEHAQAGDVAITADIPLAALLVPKGVAWWCSPLVSSANLSGEPRFAARLRPQVAAACPARSR